MQPPKPHEHTTTAAPLADLHGALHYWGPAPPCGRPPSITPAEQAAEDRAHAARIAAWLQILRAQEAAYAGQAAATGTFTPLDEDERRAVAELAVALGVPPRVAVAQRLTALSRVA